MAIVGFHCIGIGWYCFVDYKMSPKLHQQSSEEKMGDISILGELFFKYREKKDEPNIVSNMTRLDVYKRKN